MTKKQIQKIAREEARKYFLELMETCLDLLEMARGETDKTPDTKSDRWIKDA